MRSNAISWARSGLRRPIAGLAALTAFLVCAAPAWADESSLKLPNLDSVQFFGMGGRSLLMAGLVVCLLGLAFGLVVFSQVKRLLGDRVGKRRAPRPHITSLCT